MNTRPAGLKKTKGKAMIHDHLCYTGMPVRNGNLGTNYNNKGCKCTKTTGTKNSKINEGRQEKNGGVKVSPTPWRCFS